MNCFSGITNNVVPPSWTLILPESWDESKTDFKGEVDGFKIGEGEGEGRKKYATYTRSTGTLISAVSDV